MRGRLALALALGPCLLEARARAICGRPPVAYVSPEPGAPAPLNVHVRVQLHKEWRTSGICAVDDEGRERCPPGKFDFALVQAPGPGASAGEVPIVRRPSLSNEIATVELVPLAPLAPRTRYEVLYIDRGGAVATRILGTFVTGDARDDTPPQWSGVTRGTFTGHALGARGGVIVIRAECSSPSVLLAGAGPATDDATPASSLRYAIWMDDGHGPIDYASPPLVYERGAAGGRTGFFVEHGGSEVEDSFAPPKGRPRATFGVRAVDWAGNMSAPSEVRVVFR